MYSKVGALALLFMVSMVSGPAADPIVSSPGGGGGLGQNMGCGTIAGKIIKTDAAGIGQCSDDIGAATGAPTASTYILKTPDVSLPNALSLSTLATCLLRNTTGTGVLACYAGSTPVANTFLRSIDSQGAGTTSAVQTADIAAGAVLNAQVGAAAGIVESKLALNFATHTNVNDPTANEKAALGGVGGAPSGINPYVTQGGLASYAQSTDVRFPSADTPGTLSAASQINCNRPTQLLTSATSITLTDPKWLTDGDYVGQVCRPRVIHATNTITGPTTATIKNCGSTGNVVMGLNASRPDYTWDGSIWTRDGCTSLQQVSEVGRMIDGATSISTAFVAGNISGGSFCRMYNNTLECLEGGVASDHILMCGGVECERLAQSGAHTFSSVGRPRKTIVLSAAAFETDQSVCADPARSTINGHPKQTIACTDPGSDSPALYTDVLMPDSWDGGPITIQTDWFSGSNLSAQHVDTDWNGFCVSDNDTVPTHTTTGVQAALTTFGNQTNDEQFVTTAAITLNNTCAPGDHIYLRGRILAATNATMTNVRFLGVKLEYVITSRSD